MATKAAVRKKIFVLDTNVLLHDPLSLFRFHEHDLFIPFVTLEELDNHKVGTQDINRNARQSTRTLEQITTQDGSFADGFAIQDLNGHSTTGRLYLQSQVISVKGRAAVLGTKNDNQFLEVMDFLKETFKGHDATLVTKDLNLRVKARALGYSSDDYLNDHVVEDSDMLYKGYRELTDEVLEQAGDTLTSWKENGRYYYGGIPQDPKAPYLHNEMLVLPDGVQAVVKDASEDGVVLCCPTDYTNVKNNVWGVTARNEEQAFALHLLMDPEIDFITLLGPAGTGKTMLTLAAALEQVIEKKLYSEIIFTRATVPMGEDIGFLPGTEEEKMAPWMGALQDNLEVLIEGSEDSGFSSKASREQVMKHIQIKSTTFMRGRTFQRKFLVIDEAQNLTPKQMKTLITRASDGTKVICMGNLAQIDTPYLSETSSGLAYAVERFKGWKHYGHIILAKGERSRLANYANDNL